MKKLSQEQINVDLFDECKRLQAENAQLRAKADAYDDGEQMLAVKHSDSTNESFLRFDECVEELYRDSKSYTCRKVRVCKEVNEKGTQ